MPNLTDAQWQLLPNTLPIVTLEGIVRLTRKTVARRVESGQLPAHLVAGVFIIFRDELRAVLAGHTIHTVDILASYPNTLHPRHLQQLFDRSYETIRRWCAEGALPATLTDHGWSITKRDLRSFLDETSNQPPPTEEENVAGANADIETLLKQARSLLMPARIDIIRLLNQRAPHGAYMSDIIRATDIPAGSMSHHLAALEETGVINGDIPEEQRQGRSVRYTADITRLGDIFGRAFAYALS